MEYKKKAESESLSCFREQQPSFYFINLKIKDMKKIIKQEQWVMLPTDDIEHVIIEKNTGLLLLQTKRKEFSGTKNHLYLTSDDEIKEGDWMFIDEKGTKRNPGRGYVLTQHKGTPVSRLNAVCGGTVKIIATTDKSLIIIEDSLSGRKTSWLPQIPESFIKYYVEKQGEVGDVEALYNFAGITISGENEIIIKLPKEKMYSILNMASCLLSIYDSLKLEDNNSRDKSESLTEMMFRKMEGYNIDLNKELGFTHLKPVNKPKQRR